MVGPNLKDGLKCVLVISGGQSVMITGCLTLSMHGWRADSWDSQVKVPLAEANHYDTYR